MKLKYNSKYMNAIKFCKKDKKLFDFLKNTFHLN